MEDIATDCEECILDHVIYSGSPLEWINVSHLCTQYKSYIRYRILNKFGKDTKYYMNAFLVTTRDSYTLYKWCIRLEFANNR